MQKILQKYEPLLAVLLVSMVAILTHAIGIFQLGFYRDDWYLIWNGSLKGFQSIAKIFLVDRPFMGFIYSWDYFFLGDKPLNWHLYALFLQILGALALLWLLRMIFPGQKFLTTIASVLFVIYPGFLQQPNANTFQNHLFGYAVAIISIGLSIRALKSTRLSISILLSVLSVSLALVYFFVYEYMIGLEGVRFLLLWYVLYQEEAKNFLLSFIRLLKRAIIYLPGIIGFLYWRFFVFDSDRKATDAAALFGSYKASPIRGLLRLGIETAKDVVETAILAWAVPFYNFVNDASYRELANSVLLAGIVVLLLIIYFWLVRRHTSASSESASHFDGRIVFWIGLLGVISTLLPVVAAGRDVRFKDAFDRYTLQASVGVVLLVIGFLYAWVRSTPRLVVLLTLVFIGVVTHAHSINHFQEFWTHERDLWWQLSWRAPQISEDTVLVAMLPSSFRLAEAYEAYGPANLIYYPESETLKIQAEILNSATAVKIIRQVGESRSTRGAEITRDFQNTLLVSKASNLSCLHVIDGKRVELSADASTLETFVASYSKIDRILPEAAGHTPPSIIFGQEPEHKWCYYYQKANLARQRGDWELASSLIDEALEKGFKPLDRSEWMAAVEAYALTERTKDARELAKIIKDDKYLRDVLCSGLETAPAAPPGYDPKIVFNVLCE